MNRKKAIAIIFTVFLIIVGIVINQNWSKISGKDTPLAEIDKTAESWDGERKQKSAEEEPMIQIPGYEMVKIKADSLEQQGNFFNPEENTCYFRISLWQDSTTKLWESKLIEPGSGIYTLTLDHAVEKGTYDQAFLKYECFSLENQEPLNGSEVQLILESI
ncbi:tRNA (uracil-5-)-methyltransferase [Enterococcus hulanensis]|uniref:tRNA (uracil-5-)-methyltransferase n=1 Tax=Enterococcus hulanensis TaxID=2559929 RepID=UPI0028919879|nr:tRNA (uracil-5-)-methyltransferase [Enterococcus hulanensis]MDT2659273.1 tRNA (uracil-5-)-methyltransferase [Enterococcus hulanensis]